ncbi:MAG: PAS domain S-box protein [Lysobacter sp.]
MSTAERAELLIDQAFFVLDAHRVILNWRCAPESSFCYPEARVIGAHIRTMFPGYEDEIWPAEMAGHDILSCHDLVLVTTRGTYINVEVSLAMMGGVWVGMVRRQVATHREIADEERRELEELAEARTHELREANLQLRSHITDMDAVVKQLNSAKDQANHIIETAYDAFVSCDKHSVITEWNRQAVRIFGWSRVEAIGKGLCETIIPERYRSMHVAGMARLVETGKARILNRRVRLPALHRDGHEFPSELTIWFSGEGEALRFHSFVQVIGERMEGGTVSSEAIP